MSDEAEPPKAKKGGSVRKIALIAVGGLVLAVGGAFAGMYAAGVGIGGHKGPPEDPDRPRLILKDGGQQYAEVTDGARLDPRRYKASYYNIEQNFTSNMRDSDGFVQLGIGVSTFYDHRVLDALKDNEIPVRSAILMTLAAQDSFAITTPEGRKTLQKQLTDAINGVLKQKTGYGGIDNVYFTSFVIQ